MSSTSIANAQESQLTATRTPPSVPFRDTRASVLLDLVRGLAALVVLADHTHNLFFVDAGTAMRGSAHPSLTLALYSLVSAGPQAVAIFFVLSGYLISGSVFRAIERGRFTWRDYLMHRLVRLWLVLLPALLLCIVWDSATVAMQNHAGLRGFFDGLLLRHPDPAHTGRTLLGNVFFLETIRVPVLGSNRVLWSLACEFWYYLLFPLAALALGKGTSLARRLLYAILFLAIAAFVGRGVLALFPVWLLGTVLAWVEPPQLPRSVRMIAATLYAPVIFVLAVHAWTSRFVKQDYVLGLATLLFFWIVLSAQRRADPEAIFTRFSRRLSAFSYSLYLVHFPFLFFVSALLLRGGGPWRPNLPQLLVAGGCGLLAIAYAYGVASLTEFRNDRVRDWVARRLSPSARS